MGMLIEGNWTAESRPRSDGPFRRMHSQFRRWIEPDGAHPPAPGRYHLYVSLACPWASRAVLSRKLKGLEDIIGMTVVHPDMLENGWTFEWEHDPVCGWRYLYEA